MVTGQYVDPKAGRVALRDYAELWRAAQVHRPTSAAHFETMLRRHTYPTLGDRPLSSILPSEIQAWVKRLSTGDGDRPALAPATVSVVHGIVSSVFKAAVRDRRIMANPCEGTKLPKVQRRHVVWQMMKNYSRHSRRFQALRANADIAHQSIKEYMAALRADEHNEALKMASARCSALLRASQEPLPITRGAFFDHTGAPFGMDLEEGAALVNAAPQIGNPEAETPDVMRVRAEIVGAIDALREQLSK